MVVDDEDTPVVGLVVGEHQVLLGEYVCLDPVADGGVALAEVGFYAVLETLLVRHVFGSQTVHEVGVQHHGLLLPPQLTLHELQEEVDDGVVQVGPGGQTQHVLLAQVQGLLVALLGVVVHELPPLFGQFRLLLGHLAGGQQSLVVVGSGGVDLVTIDIAQQVLRITTLFLVVGVGVSDYGWWWHVGLLLLLLPGIHDGEDIHYVQVVVLSDGTLVFVPLVFLFLHWIYYIIYDSEYISPPSLPAFRPVFKNWPLNYIPYIAHQYFSTCTWV